MDESFDLNCWWLTELLLELPPNGPTWSHLVALVVAWDALEPSWRAAVDDGLLGFYRATVEAPAPLWEP